MYIKINKMLKYLDPDDDEFEEIRHPHRCLKHETKKLTRYKVPKKVKKRLKTKNEDMKFKLKKTQKKIQKKLRCERTGDHDLKKHFSKTEKCYFCI